MSKRIVGKRVNLNDFSKEDKQDKVIRITIHNDDKSYIRVLNCRFSAISSASGGIEELLYTVEPKFKENKLKYIVTKS